MLGPESLLLPPPARSHVMINQSQHSSMLNNQFHEVPNLEPKNDGFLKFRRKSLMKFKNISAQN